MPPDVRVFNDPATMARAAAEEIVLAAQAAFRAKGRFNLCLSGGNTPRLLYSLLAAPPFLEQIDWTRVDLFWGDERCVPPEDPESDFRMARESLIDRLPPGQAPRIYRLMGELVPQFAASSYESLLHGYFSSTGQGFDLLLLGMGEDGHTASLFPGTAAVHEKERWVVGHYVPRLAAWRLTLTPAFLNRAARTIFLVAGENKRAVLAEVLNGPYRPDTFPAQVIQPLSGNLSWFVTGL